MKPLNRLLFSNNSNDDSDFNNCKNEAKSQKNKVEDENLNDTILGGTNVADLLLLNSSNGNAKTDWRSIYIASFLGFCGAMQYGLFVSSMWPFLEIIDKTADETFFGYIVSSHALGQIFGSPLIGFISNRCHRLSFPLYICLVLMFFGNLLYLFIEVMHPAKYRKYFLVLSRFITGIGSSNICILRSYASSASVINDRSRAIAFITGGITLGMTMGPMFQLIFIPISYPGISLQICNLSMYTAPALAGIVIIIINIIAIHFFFRERYVSILNKSIINQEQKIAQKNLPIITITSDSLKNLTKILLEEPFDNVKPFVLPKFNRFAIGVCHFTLFTQMFIRSNLDTIGAALAEIFFSWSAREVIEVLSISQVIKSTMAFFIYLSFIFFRLDRLINFRKSCIVSLAILGVFHIITYSYPFLPRKIQTYNQSMIQNDSAHPLGCNLEKFSWCEWVRVPNPIFFFGAYIFCIGITFSNLNIAGTQQGILQMSGGLARLTGPVLVSWIYMKSGPPMVWILEIVVISLNIFLWIIFYRRMIPLKFDEIQFNGEQ